MVEVVFINLSAANTNLTFSLSSMYTVLTYYPIIHVYNLSYILLAGFLLFMNWQQL